METIQHSLCAVKSADCVLVTVNVNDGDVDDYVCIYIFQYFSIFIFVNLFTIFELMGIYISVSCNTA